MASSEFQPERLERGLWPLRLPDVKPPCILNPWPTAGGFFFQGTDKPESFENGTIQHRSVFGRPPYREPHHVVIAPERPSDPIGRAGFPHQTQPGQTGTGVERDAGTKFARQQSDPVPLGPPGDG